MQKKYSAEEILEVLHSITGLSVRDGELDTFFNHGHIIEGIHSFMPGCFTRELLELIESSIFSMLNDKESKISSDDEILSILEILHSITGISINSGNFHVIFNYGHIENEICSFCKGTFIKKLLELIECHMLGENDISEPDESYFSGDELSRAAK